jgi:Flp pilus assembly protein TadD
MSGERSPVDRDNPAMLALRVAIFALAVVTCAWFGLGAVQTRDETRATALIDQVGTPSAALTAKILRLLNSAGTLNPDREIDLLRAQAQTRAGESAAAVATMQRVVHAEPDNVDAWVILGFAAQRVDPGLAGLARQKELELAPPVPAAP